MSNDSKNEVKDVEVIDPKDIKDGDEEGGDELITDPSQLDEENETPAPASGDEETTDDEDDPKDGPKTKKSKEKTKVKSGEESKEDGSSDDDEEDDDSQGETTDDDDEDDGDDEDGELKKVEGETPRERGMRKTINKLRKSRRKERTDDLLGDQPTSKAETPKFNLTEDDEKLLAQYTPEQLKEIEGLFGVIGKKFGFVKQTEFQAQNYQTVATGILDDFLKDHPEYMPENDDGDVLWGRLKDEIGLYKQPKDPKGYRKILDRIHKDIFDIQPGKRLKKVKAKKVKIKVASHSTSTPGKKTSQPSKRGPLDPALRSSMTGFSEEELDDMFGE